MSRSLPLWQRNAIGGVVVAAGVVVLAGTTWWSPWTAYRATLHPGHIVAAGQSAPVDGRTWSVGDIRHLGPGDRPGAAPLPKGTVLTVITVDREGPPSEGLCVAVLTDGERRWRGQTPIDYAVSPAPGTSFNCARPGPLQWAFLVPGDVVPTALDITTADGQILVRLDL